MDGQDKQDKKIKDIENDRSAGRLDVAHLANFVAAMRTRRSGELACEAAEGHASAATCHLANISHRLGEQAGAEAIRERTKAHPEFADAFARFGDHLRENGVKLDAAPAGFGAAGAAAGAAGAAGLVAAVSAMEGRPGSGKSGDDDFRTTGAAFAREYRGGLGGASISGSYAIYRRNRAEPNR
jgi:hypothetical protein